jgi:spore germination cell wall hydrolase CwlJ-like protein
VAFAVLAATLATLAGAALAVPSTDGERAPAAVPAPPPLLVQPLAPTEALALNETIPLADGPNPAARPFLISANSGTAQARALDCLTSAVYYEAGSQDPDGQRAVAQIVLNRVRHPAFPASVCGVVYEGSTRATGCQFTFTCDGSLNRRPDIAGWARARVVADAALHGYVYAPVGYATHYHADYVVPYWASTLAKNAVVGAHIFYRWSGGWGRPDAFVQAYAQSEPNGDALRSAALLAEQRQQATPAEADVAKAIAEIPGATMLPTVLNRRGEARVAVRMQVAARDAVERSVHRDYVEQVQASDNLRWTLGTSVAAADDKPLGRAAAPADATASAGEQ